MYVSGHFVHKIYGRFALTRFAPGFKGNERDFLKIKFEHYC